MFFASLNSQTLGPATLLIPDLKTLDWRALLLAAGAALLLLKLKWDLLLVLALSAISGVALTTFG